VSTPCSKGGILQRTTSQAELEEILDAWFAGQFSTEPDDRANVAHLSGIEQNKSDHQD
jgi:ribose 5-phosphate isomerase B